MMKKAGLLVICLFLIALVIPVAAGNQVLSDNSGDGNAAWHISGEASVVINGFDLNSLGIQRPAVIDKLSISVKTPIPGSAVTALVYQDANGGSPVDATLAGSQQVDITSAGTFTVTFTTPMTITQPVVWVGFNLPVGFSFFADTSGTSVLTYWAWTTGGTFDLSKLSTAQTLGPADGTAPVNINMNGKARITAEITGANSSGTPTAGTQTPNGGTVNLGIMAPYSGCGNVSYDTGDVASSLLSAIALSCTQVPIWQNPPVPAGYTFKGSLYDIIAFKDHGNVEKDFPIGITHCIIPDPNDIGNAVIGNAYGDPRAWHILTTVRFGNVVCAEVRHGGNLAYFTH